ncbi:MAG: fumarate hydratase [Clostridia bacterium]|nr:fumarate hydratase [Clostridia bacterium]MBP3559509.1 fumarate hydratase [Clostridia bacterium]MBQ6838922.1 fumarate hydratase [Clostridia bacterium]
MREINVSVIEKTVEEIFLKANSVLPESLEECINKSKDKESLPIAKNIFCDMCKNLSVAKELNIPICQDTGMAVLFCELGQDVHITGGDFNTAVNNGVRKAYLDGKMRCSIVSDPLKRVNTTDNTPALIHLSLVEGDKIKLTAAPKGFGSENMSRIKMFTPSATIDDIVSFVVETVKVADANPCPPVVLGVGIGSDFEGVALLSKKALCRDISLRNTDEFYKALEERMLTEVNKLNIGAQGFGGDITALAVNIEAAPTHIAGLPVAVNVGCHVTRHCEAII